MPNDFAVWNLAEFVRGRLEGITLSNGYWNEQRRVRSGHLTIEEIQGSLENPCFTYEIDDIATIAEERGFDTDAAITAVSVRGYKKTDWGGEQWVLEREREASRLLKDLWVAMLSKQAQGLGCNSFKQEATSPTRWALVPGMPGWVECVLTVAVSHQLMFNDP